MDTAVVLPFGDGQYRFWLPLPRVFACERETEASIFALFYDIGENLGQLMNETVLSGPSPVRVKQCQSIIRNALSGGSEGLVDGETIAVGDALALDLVERYCYPARPAIHDIDMAWRILKAAIYGIQVSDTGSKKNEAKSDLNPSEKAS